MKPVISQGDLLNQDVEVIVNAWNRNLLPWWLLLPQGVSGAIKKRGGLVPFREVGRHGPIPLGGAVLTSAGRLPFKGIIHVAGINMLWHASEMSIRASVRNAMRIVDTQAFTSVAFPVIGAGSGSFNADRALTLMVNELDQIESGAHVTIVKFRRGADRDRPSPSQESPPTLLSARTRLCSARQSGSYQLHSLRSVQPWTHEADPACGCWGSRFDISVRNRGGYDLTHLHPLVARKPADSPR